MVMAGVDIKVEQKKITFPHSTLYTHLTDKVVCTALCDEMLAILDKSNTLTLVLRDQVFLSQ